MHKIIDTGECTKERQLWIKENSIWEIQCKCSPIN